MSGASDRVSLLRSVLQTKGIDAYLIPTTDLHFEEEVRDHWRTVEWLTGFTGSSALLIITDTFAGLWTDSRYFLQAEKELAGSGFMLVKPDPVTWNDFPEFLYVLLDEGTRIGLDGRLLTEALFRKLKNKLDKKKITIDTDCDLIPIIWSGQPELTSSLAFDHPAEFCGKTRERKIIEVREQMKAKGVEWQLLISRDEIMWLLNIRGHDLKYSPLLDSFCLVGEDQVLLFVDEDKIPLKIASEFDSLGIVLLPYGESWNILPEVLKGSSVLLDPSKVSVSMYDSIFKNCVIQEDISIPCRLKSVKNRVEINRLTEVMVKDGVALTKFLFWLENEVVKGVESEYGLAEKLDEFRSLQEDFICTSFPTIVAFGQNSALPHYMPKKGSDSEIGDSGILLIDSGGHYLGGTTDITRTMVTGTPSKEQRRDFTLVLKGHIKLATAKFPLGTRGYQLDILAREALWASGMNYGHGTGHGIGFCLNVHEGPQSISPADNKNIIEPGMILSNEPAVYRDQRYGIRIENVMVCFEDEETEFGKFLRFDTLSLCFISRDLIEKSLLEAVETAWINSYHSEVFRKISPFLTEGEKLWLMEKTSAL